MTQDTQHDTEEGGERGHAASSQPDPERSAEEARHQAARLMGQARSERKRAAVRENGKKGGRPRGSTNNPESRAKMRDAQRQRREREAAQRVADVEPS